MEINRTGRALNHRDRKNPKAHELWMKTKRENRLKQHYLQVTDQNGQVWGSWVKDDGYTEFCNEMNRNGK